jgi:hypothetical protein
MISVPSEPPSPEGVRVVDEHGVEYPVQCVYMGFEQGNHVWDVVDVPRDARIVTVKARKIPSHTAIRVPL